MVMANLYTLIIFPLVQFIELVYLLAFRLFNNECIAIVGVSLIVSVCTLPLYFMAEKQQQAERETQRKLKPVIDNIRAVFTGDKRFMILQTYYRQNHYHPVFALRSTLSLLIQIPFFIAAYTFLSNLEVLQGVSFFLIKDLGKPDELFVLGGHTINLLPILMTSINVISGAIYTRDLLLKDKIQVYGMAVLFLLLLYNSPSGMVIYWTGNNIFALIKNILQHQKDKKRIIFDVFYVLAIVLIIYALTFYNGPRKERIILAFLVSCVFFLPFLPQFMQSVKGKVLNRINLETSALVHRRTYFLSCGILFLLAGFVIPGSLIASSVEEFSFIEDYRSPFPFLFTTLLQSAGLFLFWPGCIYMMFSKRIKKWLTLVMTLLCGIILVNVFLFSGDYGHLDQQLKISNVFGLDNTMLLLNLGITVFAAVVLVFLVLGRKSIFCYSLQVIILVSVFIFGDYQVLKIKNEFSDIHVQKNILIKEQLPSNPKYEFSKYGKNVLVIMLDRASTIFLPFIFEEKPDLLDSFKGFVFYPNTVSYSYYTLFANASVFGGYEYTPLEIQKRDTVPLVDKQREAHLMLPRIFSDNGFTVTVDSMPYENYSGEQHKEQNIKFEDFPEIRRNNTAPNLPWMTNIFKNYNPGSISSKKVLKNNLIRFSMFKFAPPLFRKVLYDDGNYLVVSQKQYGLSDIPELTLKVFLHLKLLPELTSVINNQENTYTVVYNLLPHSPAFFNIPDYDPFNKKQRINRGNGPLANERHYHVNMASFLLLEKWFDLLKANGVYDNTRIIIVGDHGSWSETPGGTKALLESKLFVPPFKGLKMGAWQPLLLVKDFYSKNEFDYDYRFMTNADVPLLALEGIIESPINPFTHKELKENKENGVIIQRTPDDVGFTRLHRKYTFDFDKGYDWYHVHDNIFDPANWSDVEVKP
ncbi:membrane protein [Spirochaetia bacterium]|nr:membrane protein [Spirochaetia bacterium]